MSTTANGDVLNTPALIRPWSEIPMVWLQLCSHYTARPHALSTCSCRSPILTTTPLCPSPEPQFSLSHTGLGGAWIGLTVQHCGNHGAMSTRAWVNKALGLCDDLIGGSSLMWRYHHQVPFVDLTASPHPPSL